MNANEIINSYNEKKQSKNTQQENSLVESIKNNETAIELAKKKFNEIGNQEKIGNRMNEIVKKKVNADMNEVETTVIEQQTNDNIKRAELRNRLYKAKTEHKTLVRERRHELKMQKYRHRKDKFGELLKRHNIDYLPGIVKIYIILALESIVETLNQTADIISKVNKNLVRSVFIILVLILIFVEPVREWFFTFVMGR